MVSKGYALLYNQRRKVQKVSLHSAMLTSHGKNSLCSSVFSFTKQPVSPCFSEPTFCMDISFDASHFDRERKTAQEVTTRSMSKFWQPTLSPKRVGVCRQLKTPCVGSCKRYPKVLPTTPDKIAEKVPCHTALARAQVP